MLRSAFMADFTEIFCAFSVKGPLQSKRFAFELDLVEYLDFESAIIFLISCTVSIL